ncbi:MAG: hypothetical protein MUE97_01590 [Phycisphaerales bacterium]|jgi:hypothetical protein|nr:hypothetical protein [Phycisphaerales bacterium]
MRTSTLSTRTLHTVTLAATLSVTLALTAGGCQTHRDTTSASSLNAVCPLGGEPVDPKITSTFAGQKVAFCCNGCKAAFDSSNDAEKRRVLAKAQGK